jgi:hypothetical protein
VAGDKLTKAIKSSSGLSLTALQKLPYSNTDHVKAGRLILRPGAKHTKSMRDTMKLNLNQLASRVSPNPTAPTTSPLNSAIHAASQLNLQDRGALMFSIVKTLTPVQLDDLLDDFVNSVSRKGKRKMSFYSWLAS